MHRPLGPFVLLALVIACGTEGPFEPPPAPAETDATAEARGARRIDVLTRNLYVGADVDAVIGALVSPSPDDDLAALTLAIQTLQRTDFPTRAGAIADEIARARPHAVGLQEVSEIHIDLTPLQIPVTLDLDFLPVLQQALAVRGLHYVVGATVKNIEAAPLPGVSLVDYDALLIDADRVITGHTSHPLRRQHRAGGGRRRAQARVGHRDRAPWRARATCSRARISSRATPRGSTSCVRPRRPSSPRRSPARFPPSS
jgi:hypothetical protein